MHRKDYWTSLDPPDTEAASLFTASEHLIQDSRGCPTDSPSQEIQEWSCRVVRFDPASSAPPEL